MNGKRFLNSVKFTNLLSFGPEGMELELQPLNVLIGANGSGKSNFIDAMRIIQAIPIDISIPFSKGDTASEWINKHDTNNVKIFSVEFIMEEERLKSDFSKRIGSTFYYYYAEIDASKPRARFNKESYSTSLDIVNIFSKDSIKHIYEHNNPNLKSMINKLMSVDDHILAKFHFQDMIQLSSVQYIRIYSDYELGRYSKIRMPQNASLDPGDIFEGFGNLSLVINDLISRPDILRKIIEKMQVFYENIVNVNTRIAFGTIQLYLQETGLSETIPATRLSDGTIRFLSLLAILLHPKPPPLICLEEPEIGMHPDIIHVIADLLIEASQRTQLVITTHSDILVSAIGRSYPEAIVVCEKDKNGTRMKRLDPEKMNVWLEKYSLGELWTSGEIGGTRW